MPRLSDWKQILRERNICLRKTRGQNFLSDPNICEKIVAQLDLNPADAVLEIGPGMAALTESLLQKAGFVLAVEIQREFCELLSEWYGMSGPARQSISGGRFEVLQSDVLKIDIAQTLETLRARAGAGGSVKIVSNLPYYITTPILTRFLEHADKFSRMVFTMQKEVADRITAGPGGKTYGSLSVFTQFFCEAKTEFKIPPGAFFPSPQVASAVVRFTPRSQPPVLLLDRKLFFALVRASFTQRRKTLRNSLKAFFTRMGLDAVQGEQLLDKCGVDGRRRAETLSMQEFARMANLLSQWRAGRA